MIKMKKRVGTYLVLLIMVAAGCYPYPETEVYERDLDIVITNFNDSTDFQAISTYILVDSVAVLTEDGAVGSDDPFYERGYDQVVLDEMRTQLNALGYTEVFESRNADVGVVATGLRVVNTEIVSVPGWWWGYPGYGYWWDSWYGYPYSGYYPPFYSTYYSYEKGSVIINMVDLEATEPKDAFIWSGLINGLISNDAPITPDRLSMAVESAFKQSRNFYPRETN